MVLDVAASSEGSSFRKATNLEQVGVSGDGCTEASSDNTLKTTCQGQARSLTAMRKTSTGNVMNGEHGEPGSRKKATT